MRSPRSSLLALVSVTAAFALLAAGCGSVSSYAATVDGTRISKAELEEELRDIAANDQYLKYIESQVQVRSSGVFDAAFTARVLTQQIVYELVHQDLERRKITLTRADLDAGRQSAAQRMGGEEILNGFDPEYQETLARRAAEVTVLSFVLLEQGPPDQAAKAYYDSHPDEFAQACVNHILVATKEEGDQVKGRLDAGEPFAEVAKQVSRDSGSAPQGGELGCFTRDNQLVAEFAQAMFTQPVGQVGPPVQTQYGFHLILVKSRDVPPYDQVAAAARDKAVAAGQEKLANWFNGVIEKAEVDVNPQYGRFEKKGGDSQVVPPQAPTTAPAAPTAGDQQQPHQHPEPAPAPAPAPAPGP
ncbi:MAG TPA: peptidylprolyl isomerase [Acidimicrobiales bacterium]|nr:peptidylprolyl isomerase [Acidimicrobiales bacterium]